MVVPRLVNIGRGIDRHARQVQPASQERDHPTFEGRVGIWVQRPRYRGIRNPRCGCLIGLVDERQVPGHEAALGIEAQCEVRQGVVDPFGLRQPFIPIVDGPNADVEVIGQVRVTSVGQFG